MKNKLLIIGASGHGKVVADIAIKMNKWNKIEFLDDNPNLTSSLGLNVVGNSNQISEFIGQYDIFVGIGNNRVREKIYKKLELLGASIPVLIHPSAILAEQVQIEKGTTVMARVVINSSTNIGKGCIINTGCTIDHDNNIEDYVHISPGANLAGGVTVGKNSWIGIGSNVSNNVSIFKGCMVGAGGVVIRDIKEPGVYVGVPVRRVIK
ncbi:acetyltransferase [Virgibacillus kimchii]